MKHRTLASLAAMPWLAAAALAGQAPAEEEGAFIEEVIVRGDRVEETIPLDLRQFGNRVEVITADELQRGGFNDVAKSLQMKVPGLYLAPKNGAFDYVGCSLQGSRCQDILWLIDGVRINNRLYNSTSPLDTVPAHMVERIEVLYGGQGIFYGTQSVAGVVNIVTKSFSDSPGGRVGLGVDGNDGRHASVDYRASSGGHRFVVYASSDEAGGIQPYKDDDIQPSTTDRDRSYDVTMLGLKYAYEVSERARLSLQYQHTDAELDFARAYLNYDTFNARDEDIVTLKYDLQATDSIGLFVKAYSHTWDTNYTRIYNVLDDNGAVTGNRRTVNDGSYWGYDDYGLTAMARIETGGGFDFAAGYEHQRFSGSDDVLLIADQTESVNAFFGQIRTNEDLLARTRMALGLRHNSPSGDGKVTVGNFSLRHDFTDSVYLRGSAGTSFRLPDAWQLYGNDPCCTMGNPDLEGEKSRNVNVAIGAKRGSGLRWEVIGFQRAVDDLIGVVDGMRVNTDRTVDFGGWEFNLAYEFAPDWTAGFNYVATSAEAEGGSEQITDVPESTLKASLSYRAASSPVELVLTLLNVGELYDSVSGGIGRVEHGGYTVLDLGGAYRFGNGDRHRIGIRLENALDEEYASSLGRSFRDVDGSSYPYANLGTPRTFHVAYTFRL
ncbi:MAG: TonB-dependent receptor [Gammaproteobacteria bacterium]|nr:TonB-dependent receptor [Gammaproteobacteria bacterium]